MSTNRWILPDGIEEILHDQAWQIEELRRRLLDSYRESGYEFIIPPMVEFTDSLITGVGEDLDLDTFKMIDQISGRTLGLRSDMSPQVARIDSYSLKNQGVNRLCYAGTTLKTLPKGPDASRSPIQVGAEIFGERDSSADEEIVLLMLKTLELAGIEQITLDLGHVGVFAELAKRIEDCGESADHLFELIQGKRLPEIGDWVAANSSCDPSVAAVISALPALAGGIEVLDKSRVLFSDFDSILQIIDQFEALVLRLTKQCPEVNLFLDLAEVRGSNYHSGLVFAAYAPNYGSSIANGGRYDQVGAAFGSSRPATGFSADLKALVVAGKSAA